ncbi:MAG: hypothetical protein KKB70_08565 [Proteobacteria bacterium]|nr:hypothetical protein [Pseudomonadota bacterium]
MKTTFEKIQELARAKELLVEIKAALGHLELTYDEKTPSRTLVVCFENYLAGKTKKIVHPAFFIWDAERCLKNMHERVRIKRETDTRKHRNYLRASALLGRVFEFVEKNHPKVEGNTNEHRTRILSVCYMFELFKLGVKPSAQPRSIDEVGITPEEFLMEINRYIPVNLDEEIELPDVSLSLLDEARRNGADTTIASPKNTSEAVAS